jgi:hypothetical protein
MRNMLDVLLSLLDEYIYRRTWIILECKTRHEIYLYPRLPKPYVYSNSMNQVEHQPAMDASAKASEADDPHRLRYLPPCPSNYVVARPCRAYAGRPLPE